METYETSATVEEQGRVRVAGVPFAPGTQVRITMNVNNEMAATADDPAVAAARERMRELFSTVKGLRMTPRFSREELYDRKCLR